jgi:hypothetical protein
MARTVLFDIEQNSMMSNYMQDENLPHPSERGAVQTMASFAKRIIHEC